MHIRFRILDFGLLAAAGLLLSACSSGSGETVTPKLSSAVAERDVIEGKAQLSSTIRVMFDRDWELAETDLPFASLFELTVPRADGTKKRVLVKTAERSETNTRIVTLTVDALVPEGSKLTVERKAFERKATGTIDVDVEGEFDEGFAVLASQAMVVTKESFYDDPVIAPVTDADRDPVAMRLALQQHLAMRGSEGEVAAAALALYDTMSVELVPSPKLRAALAALIGTFAEPGVQSLLTGNNCTGVPAAGVFLQEPRDNPELIAQVTHRQGARMVSVNPFAEGERIEHLMPILAHEAVHCDREDGIYEEVAATAFDGFLYLQLIAVDPELADVRTKVARELNIDAVAMLNSGARYPESIGILQSIGVEQALPLTNSPARSFADVVAIAYRSLPDVTSPSESIGTAYAAILAESTGMDAKDPFDITYLDELISRAVDPGVLAAAIVAFELAPHEG